MPDVCFTVLIREDANERSVYEAKVPGIPGRITSSGTPDEAVQAVGRALRALAASVGEGELLQLSAAQPELSIRELKGRVRVERVCIRTRSVGSR